MTRGDSCNKDGTEHSTLKLKLNYQQNGNTNGFCGRLTVHLFPPHKTNVQHLLHGSACVRKRKRKKNINIKQIYCAAEMERFGL